MREGKARSRPEPEDVGTLVDAIGAGGRSGDVGPLVRLLSEKVDFVSDGGGKAVAALNLVSGRGAVTRLLQGLASKYHDTGIALRPVQINGAPVAAMEGPELSLSLLTFDTDATGRIAGIYLMRNPDKFAQFSI